MNNLIVKNISFSYSEEEEVLNHISFSLEEHDFLCVYGTSGSGKTTLLKVISGLLEEDEGEIIMNDRLQKNIPCYKRKIGLVFQEPKLYPHLTIYENLMLGIKHIKLSYEEKDTLVKKMMKTFHLLSYMNIKPKYLSLGEQEKVALAKVFLVSEDLYLFDEPMSGLDVLSRKKTLRYINKIRKENPSPMIYVSHDEENIPSFATKILILKDGQGIFFHSLEEMKRHPVHIDVLNYFSQKFNHLLIKVVNHQLYYDDQCILSSSLPDGSYILSISVSQFYLSDDHNGFSFLMKKDYLDKNGHLILEGYSCTHKILVPLAIEEEKQIQSSTLFFNFHIENSYLFKEDGTFIKIL